MPNDIEYIFEKIQEAPEIIVENSVFISNNITQLPVNIGEISDEIVFWLEFPTFNGDKSGVTYYPSDYFVSINFFGESSDTVFITRVNKKLSIALDEDKYFYLPNITQVLPCTIYLVINQTGDISDFKTLLHSNNGINIGLKNGAPSIQWGSTNFIHNETVENWSLIKIILTEEEISVSLNGETAQIESHSETNLTNWLDIGAKSFIGSVGELIIINEELSEDNDTIITNYLKTLYNIE